MPTRREVAAFAKSLPDPYLECRRFGHPWKAYTVDKDGPRFVETTQCPRCESTRTQVLDRRGMIVGHANVNYSDGYLAHGIGRITGEAKGILRLEGMHRVMAQMNGPGDTTKKPARKRKVVVE